MVSKILTFVIGTLLICCSVEASTSNNVNNDESPSRNSYEAIYQFGDSISDTGNFKTENPSCSFAKPPYGETYFHRPTGRSSDGRLIIDYLAEYSKLPLLDPYLNKQGNFSHGVNFAVIGATALNIDALAKRHITPFTNHSLSVQLGWFKSHLSSICSNPTECKEKLSKALFMVGEIGGNDYNFALLRGMPMQEAYQMVPEVVQTIKNTVEELINVGATHVAVPGNFPIGCMTIYLKTFKTNDTTMYDELKCLKYLNEFAKAHNDQLQQEILKLKNVHPNVTITYIDYFDTLRDILQHAGSLGFDQSSVYKACCGVGHNDYNFDPGRSCGNDGVPACENPEKRVSWDGIHLTGHAYEIMAKVFIKKL